MLLIIHHFGAILKWSSDDHFYLLSTEQFKECWLEIYCFYDKTYDKTAKIDKKMKSLIERRLVKSVIDEGLYLHLVAFVPEGDTGD